MAYVTAGPEYERAWSVIEDVYGSTACRFEGETWEYMGTFERETGPGWLHNFRHRRLPGGIDAEPDGLPAGARVKEMEPHGPEGSRRVYLTLRAPGGWEPPADVVTA